MIWPSRLVRLRRPVFGYCWSVRLGLFSVPLVFALALAGLTSASAGASRLCSPKQLSAAAVSYTGAMGDGLIDFRFTNNRARCELRGYPTVRPISSGGHVIDVREVQTRQPFPNGKQLPLHAVTLVHGGFAYFELVYGPSDARGLCKPYATSVRIEAPHAHGSLMVKLAKGYRVGLCRGVRVSPVTAGA